MGAVSKMIGSSSDIVIDSAAIVARNKVSTVAADRQYTRTFSVIPLANFCFTNLFFISVSFTKSCFLRYLG